MNDYTIARDISEIPPEERTLQDFRNELQERSFKELRKMQAGGDTLPSNIINGLLQNLDGFYGTHHQLTQTEIKAYEKAQKGEDDEPQ